MGSIILCQKTKAENPYEITRIHKKIYTIEELCYYLCHNIYLIDNTIMNEQFCGWIEEELKLDGLARDLREALLDHCSRDSFILLIVQEANIYSQRELRNLEDVLMKIKDTKEIERQKYKGDNLLENGEIEEAILVYQAILREERDDTINRMFYGKVYACLAAAYGKAFLYEEAMEMYDEAFQICNDPMLVKCYLYAARRHLSETDYKLFLAKSEVFEELDEIISNEMYVVKKSIHINPTKALFEKWKNDYRSGHTS